MISAKFGARARRLFKAASRVESLEQRVLFSVYTVTNLADDGSAGTLRWAVDQANLNSGAGPNTINFSPGLSGTIVLSNGELELSGGQTTITGPDSGGLTVSGDDNSTIFRVDFGAQVSIAGLTMSDGGDGVGAAIDNVGTTHVSDCVFNNNSTAAGVGGAIYDSGTFTVTDSTFSANSSGDGGAIDDNVGNLTIDGCTFSGNTATGNGGAINANFSTVVIMNSTFNGNSSAGQGGAIYDSFSTITITNCTIAGNTAATDGGGLHVEPGGGDTTLYNTIVASNVLDGGVVPSDIFGSLDQTLASGQPVSSNNLIGMGGAGGLSNGTNGNLVAVTNPNLGPLQNNGGLTQTMALLAGSVAIDAGNNALALDTNGNALTSDQRDQGFDRILNGIVDIGAYESAVVPVVPPVGADTLTVTPVTQTTGRKIKLTATLLDANGNALAGQTITFMLNGMVVGTAVTNSHGLAKLCTSLAGITPGTDGTGITASFAGDADSAAVMNTASLTVDDARIRARAEVRAKCSSQTATAQVDFTQDRAGAVASDFTATINWGDGSAVLSPTMSSGGRWQTHFTLNATHAYPVTTATTSYKVTITITSQYGATKTITTMVTIQGTPPTQGVTKHKK